MILSILTVTVLINSFLVSGVSIKFVEGYKNNINISNTNLDVEELPEWFIGNYWKYDMDFVFIVRDGSSTKFSIDGNVADMYAIVTNVVEIDDNEVYSLSLNGHITGELSLFKADINIADLDGTLNGVALIDKNTLGIKKFVFEVDGSVDIPLIGERSLYFVMNLDFIPYFDFFNFPIYTGEEPWDVHVDQASLYAYVDVDVPFGEQEYNSSMVFNDVIMIDRTETVTVPAGVYDSIVLSGTWGYISDLWYAHDIGYLAKVDEGLYWNEGEIESVYHLNLIETNYDASNSPPDKPTIPVGPVDGTIEKEYYYSTQTIDPDGNDVYYLFDWGDGSDSGWLGPYPSGSLVTTSHMWYTKGVYNVVIKAKDVKGIESMWSDPLSITIKGDPRFTILVHKIEKKDEIDWDPLDNSPPPEWYYQVAVINGSYSSPKLFCNTRDGSYSTNGGDWNSVNTWIPDKEHVFMVNKREVVFTIKLMDYDDPLLEGGDDLADVSGCNTPDSKGLDDSISNKRGAIFHGTYDVVTKKLKNFGTGNPDENADFWYKEDRYYIISGDNKPDNSIEYEHGMKDPENDATVWFHLSNDYKPPSAMIQLLSVNEEIRPNQKIQFLGYVKEGIPPYRWFWNFNDGTTSNYQNPVHVFNEKGVYTIVLTVTDAFDQTSSQSIQITVKNNDPILTNDRVEWTGDGSLKDTFMFSVHYIDPDMDTPSVKKIVIDNVERTLVGSGSNVDYKLVIPGSEIGRGEHSFYFYFEDGYGGVAQTSKKTFKITKNIIFHSINYYKVFLDEFVHYFISRDKISKKILSFVLEINMF